MTTHDGANLLGWCVVANVATHTRHGPGGQDIYRGLNHFAAGAKVWVLPVQWGDGGENVFVVGRHRGTAHRGYPHDHRTSAPHPPPGQRHLQPRDHQNGDRPLA